VVTGTLPAGTVHRGDVLELNGRLVAVRGLQCLGEPVVEVSGGGESSFEPAGKSATGMCAGATRY